MIPMIPPSTKGNAEMMIAETRASPVSALTFATTYTHYRDYGYGRWAVLHRPTGGFLGWCGLKYHPETRETDLGFRLLLIAAGMLTTGLLVIRGLVRGATKD